MPSALHQHVHQRFRELFGEPDNTLGRDDHWSLKPDGPKRASINVLVNGTVENPAIWVFDPHSKNDGVMRQLISHESELEEIIKLIHDRVRRAAARRLGESSSMGPTQSQSVTPPSACAEYSESVPGAALDAVLYRNELEQRPSRPPTDDALHSAFKRLLAGMSTAPQTVLQSLAETILEVMHCDSAGVSIVNEDDSRFFWPAIAGVWKPHIGGGTPRHFGPCGDVLQFNQSLHMRQIHKRYTYFTPVALVNEVLLVPFYVDRQAVGTIWAVIHEPPDNERSKTRNPPRYDLEDLRVLEALGRLASAAYDIWRGHRNHTV
jgi:hypothetical protein